MEGPTKSKRKITGIIFAALFIIGLPLLLAGIASMPKVQNDTKAIATMLLGSETANEPVLVEDEKMRRELELLIDSQISIIDGNTVFESDKIWAVFWRRQDASSPEDYGLSNLQNYRTVADIADGRYVAFELEKDLP